MSTTVSQLEPLGPIMPSPRPEPLGSSLTAAAQRMTRDKIVRVGNKGGTSAWQEDAWDMYDLVGEQRFLANTLANRMGQARFYVGRLPKDTTEDIEVVEEGPAYEAFQSLIGKGQHFNQMVTRLGINLFLPGDGYLLGTPPDSETPEEVMPPQYGIAPEGKADPMADIDVSTLTWAMYSVTEVSIDDNTGEITVKGQEDGDTKKYPADAVVLIRVWRPHPRKWWEADSPTRSSLPVLRELVGLTMHISAQVDSRLAGAGVLLVPSSADAALRAASGSTDVSQESPFASALMLAMTTAIQDRSNASALVPLMPVVPDESIEKFRFMTMAGSLDAEARVLRDEAIRRLALGQDCPPELLLGVGGMNHWGAWLVREDVVTTHLEPPLSLICDAITTQFLWPVLEQVDGVAEEDTHEYVIWYDVDHLITRPNRSQDALAVHGVGALSNSTLRDAAGFDESDAPVAEPKDPVIAMALSMANQNPSLITNPGLAALTEQVRAMLDGIPVPAPEGQPEPPADAGGDEADAEPEQQGTPATADAPMEEPND